MSNQLTTIGEQSANGNRRQELSETTGDGRVPGKRGSPPFARFADPSSSAMAPAGGTSPIGNPCFGRLFLPDSPRWPISPNLRIGRSRRTRQSAKLANRPDAPDARIRQTRLSRESAKRAELAKHAERANPPNAPNSPNSPSPPISPHSRIRQTLQTRRPRHASQTRQTRQSRRTRQTRPNPPNSPGSPNLANSPISPTLVADFGRPRKYWPHNTRELPGETNLPSMKHAGYDPRDLRSEAASSGRETRLL